MIVVTDGESDDTISTRHAAELARANGIVMFSVGVGSRVNQNELSTIATSPDCTHVFTVTNYEEIKAIKEEIQKSSCQAPVYIKYNVTYTCEIQKCPPMALITTPGGATLETNMTCGLGNVYTAFTNPYPGESFYEVVKQTSNENPGVLFRNSSSTQTLYINVVDALKSTTSSEGCIVHITPKKGDQTNHNVRCFIDGKEIKCPDDCKEKWNFPNPMHCR
uniref:VWFA domain-containing protein n=1 Tax=Pinctada fucata TaxID=50426 RepID=A0A194ANW2_PINFU